jgi:FKBP-type peptidyl-prolyl cis-trans isomerase
MHSIPRLRHLQGKEIVAALLSEGAKAGSGETVTTESGLSYVDELVGPATAPTPEAGKLIGANVEVQIADQTFKKTVAFTYGAQPYKSVVCKGLEEGILGMRVGGKRTITMPVELGPPSIKLPPGVPLVYKVELTEVFQNYM